MRGTHHQVSRPRPSRRGGVRRSLTGDRVSVISTPVRASIYASIDFDARVPEPSPSPDNKPVVAITSASRVEAEFDSLVDQWRRETRFLSSVQSKIFHPAYQRIIGMGRPVLPLILRELRERDGHWFWALQCITGENPAASFSSMAEARAAWLAYAVAKQPLVA